MHAIPTDWTAPCSATLRLPSDEWSDERTAEALIDGLLQMAEAHEPGHRRHAETTALFADWIGQELGVTPKMRKALRQAAMLHDLGKLCVPAPLLTKPGALEGGELQVVRNHAAIGARLLGTIRVFEPLAPLVRHHHERWDGQGYPDGLAGIEIPLPARILALAEGVATLLDDRPYRRGCALSNALAEIEGCSGAQYDPESVRALASALAGRGLFVS